MAGTDGIDVVSLHGDNIFHQLFSRHMTAAYRAEFMTVHALEHDSSAVQHHNIVFHLESAEAYPVRNHFRQSTCIVKHLKKQVIKHR